MVNLYNILILFLTLMLSSCVNQLKFESAENDIVPELKKIDNASVPEGLSISMDIDEKNTNSDIDSNGEILTYACYYDQVVDNTVSSTLQCSTLGLIFSSSTGKFFWEPDYGDAGLYEFKVTAKNSVSSTFIIFNLNVENSPAKPLLDNISNLNIAENFSFSTLFDVNDDNNDSDYDGNTITYDCEFDLVVDGSVSSGTSCNTLPGTSNLNTTTGVFSWTTDYSSAGIYEFKVTGTSSGGDHYRVFTIQVDNTNRPPVIDPIADIATAENVAFTQIDATDGGDDLDGDLDSLTYSCSYDQSINSINNASGSCSSLPGTANFVASTGVFNWTPDYSSAGTYEIWITATDGSLSDEQRVLYTVSDVNQAPVIDAIADQTIAENSALTQINTNDGGDDQDADGDSLTYNCTFEQTINSTNDSGANCSTLPGTISFNTSTGVLDWTPSFTASGNYEIWITANDGALSDEEKILVTVSNVSTAPELATISDQAVNEGVAITQIDANDGGDDFDLSSSAITYQCKYDIVIDSSVGSPADCSLLSGLSFDVNSGVFDWTPDQQANSNGDGSGRYEFKIIATSTGGSDEEVFVITVNQIDVAPELTEIADLSTSVDQAMPDINFNDSNSSADIDADGQTLSYSCQYDNVADDTLTSGTTCNTGVDGFNFSTSTGIIEGTPTVKDSYEFHITASDGLLVDTKVIVIKVIEPTTILIGSATGYFYISTDSGVSFDKVTIAAADGRSVIYRDHNAISADKQFIAIGYYSTSSATAALYHSSNGGDTWSTKSLSAAGNFNSTGASMSDSGQYVVTNGWNGYGLYVSNDYGSTFTKKLSTCTGAGFNMSKSGQYIYCIHWGSSSIFKSSDYGQNFYFVGTSAAREPSPMILADDGLSFTFGDKRDGGFHITSGGASSYTINDGVPFYSPVGVSPDGQWVGSINESTRALDYSKDGGSNWLSLNIPGSGTSIVADMIITNNGSDNEIFVRNATNEPNKIFKLNSSEDGFDEVYDFPAAISTFTFSKNHIIVTLDNKTVYVSDRNTINFSLTYTFTETDIYMTYLNAR
jgi:photosystem II stability/assembly factor-like uncharacterized protein